jgi:hypothetical protein
MSEDYGPRRGSMPAQEMRTQVTIGDRLAGRDLNEILRSVASVLAEWRAPGTAGAERRVLLRRRWPELGQVLDRLNGPRS